MKRKITSFQQISEILKQSLNDAEIYLILDAAQVSDATLLFINQLRSDTRIDFYSIFAGTTEGNAPFEASPLLMVINDLSLLDDEKFNFMDDVWRNEQALNLVFSHLTLEKFIKKMKKYLTVEFPDGSQKIFRWFDPRIVKKIDKVLDDEQEEEFFNDIEKWVISVRNYYDVNANQIMILERV